MLHGTAGPEDLETSHSDTYKQLLATNSSKIAFYTTMQFLCYDQLKTVKAHTQSKRSFP